MAAEVDRGRRNAIRLIVVGTTGLILSGCQDVPLIVFENGPASHLERKGDYEPGDVVRWRTDFFLPRLNLYFPIPDFSLYADRTKMGKYDRRVFTVQDLRNPPKGQLPKYEIDIESLLGPDYIKAFERGGGEFIYLYSGFLTNEDEQITDFTGDLIGDPNSGTFFMQRRELKDKDFNFANISNFSYGSDNYNWEDTGKPLKDNIENARNFAEENQKASPLSQGNGFAHSLGTVYLFEAAMDHPDWYNNLFFYSPCIRGIEVLGNLPPIILRRYPRILQDLARRWHDPAHQRKIREFVPFFTKGNKKRLIEFRAEDDPLSSHIEGAEQHVIKRAGLNPLDAHGLTLHFEDFARIPAEAIGKKAA